MVSTSPPTDRFDFPAIERTRMIKPNDTTESREQSIVKPRTEDELLRLARIAASRCYIRDPAIDYDDLKQTACVALLRRPDLDGPFAVMKARSFISDLRRSNQVKRRQEMETLGETYQVYNAEDHVKAIAEDEERELIRNHKCLNKQQRLVVGLLLDGLTQMEIVAKTGISKTGVGNQVTLAVRRLREYFGLPSPGQVRMGRGKASSV